MEREGTGQESTSDYRLSTIGFDKSCIAYSAAYTFAYYSLLLSVLLDAILLFYGLLGWKGRRLVFGKGVLAWALVDGKVGYTGWWSRMVAIARAISMKILQLRDNFCV